MKGFIVKLLENEHHPPVLILKERYEDQQRNVFNFYYGLSHSK
jgi:hypothetical protein